MKQKMDKKAPDSVELKIEVDEADIAPLKRQVLQNLGAKLKVKGFREGKAPADVVEKELSSNYVQQQVLEAAINRFYGMAASNEKLRAFDQPEINIESWVPYTELKYTAIVPIIPDFKLPDVSKIKVPLKVEKVADKQIAEVLDRLTLQMAEKKEVKRAAKNGDEAWIDFKGVDKDGEDIKGADGKEYPLALGSNTFIPGFEDEVVGLKPGDEKTFDITFPKDYHAANLANAKVKFTVKVNKVKEVVKAKIDDELAKKMGPFESLAKLKEDIKKQLEDENQQQAERKHREEALSALVDKTKLTPPAKLVESIAESIRRDFMQNLLQRGLTKQEYLKQQKQTEEEFEKTDVMPNAEKRAKTSLVLAELADAEKIQVSKDELEKTHEGMKERYKDNADMLKALDSPEARGDIANQILTEKTIEHLVKKVQ